MNEKNASAGPGAKEEGVGPVKDASDAPGLQNTGPVSAEENNPAPETGTVMKGTDQAGKDEPGGDPEPDAKEGDTSDGEGEKSQALAARLEEDEKELSERQERHRRTERNAKKGHATRLKALQTGIGALVVAYDLLRLAEVELEGAMMEMKERMGDPKVRAAWAEAGRKGAADRALARRPDETFYIGLRGLVSDAFRKALVELGCRFTTRSSNFATLKAKTAPEALIAQATANNQAVWTLDADMEKVFVYAPVADKESGADSKFKEDAKKTATAARRIVFPNQRFAKPGAAGINPAKPDDDGAGKTQ